MNENTLKGQWTQLKGKVREQWGKLTDDDIDQVQGRSEQLIGKIQQRYGIARDEAQRQVNGWTPKSRRRKAPTNAGEADGLPRARFVRDIQFVKECHHGSLR
jgi:uncharacterized protein YjbJ (UPF0337 family)